MPSGSAFPLFLWTFVFPRSVESRYYSEIVKILQNLNDFSFPAKFPVVQLAYCVELCRSREKKRSKIEPTLAIVGVDTAEK